MVEQPTLFGIPVVYSDALPDMGELTFGQPVYGPSPLRTLFAPTTLAKRSPFDDLGDKAAARILLSSDWGIAIPSWNEWCGINLLERDGEL